jgi:hypothetical protein
LPGQGVHAREAVGKLKSALRQSLHRLDHQSSRLPAGERSDAIRRVYAHERQEKKYRTSKGDLDSAAREHRGRGTSLLV